MNSVVVVFIGFIVAFIGYRVYAKYIDTKVIKADPKKATPAKMYMDGVEFMPTSKSILFGYQFKSIAGRPRSSGPIIAIQWGWLPAPDLDLGRRFLYRLGPGLFQCHGGHAKRRGLLWGFEPQADFSKGTGDSSRLSSISIFSSLPEPSAMSSSAPPSV